MALSPEEVAHLQRQARRRAERAAAEMSFRNVSSDDYLMKLRAKRRPGRRHEVGDIVAAVEIGEEPLPPSQPEFRRPTGPERQRTHTRTQSASATIPGPQQRAASTPVGRRATLAGPISRSAPVKAHAPSQRYSGQHASSQPDLLMRAAQRQSVSTPGPATGLKAARSSPKPRPPRPRSSLSIFYPRKSVRRVASVGAISSKKVDSQTAPTLRQPVHTRSKSVHATAAPSEPPARPGTTLTKRGSLRMLKDTIRRVASSFELRSTRTENTGLGNDDGLKHRSSRSLLLRPSRKLGSQLRLGTVSEE
ncbi:uncharacterized protein LY79DRAFT_592981 [Colletotrichum navitas]|uniref:Uncharacterized protein n=1 Tax=Colletotrichum navitas TaxID=681940 RepID=A0AAD8PSC6_9PEZI|nr:uncharacterized protein LY79DRAFT_592981 [Colletotrichum navitas]KAK1579194.1 hypothetical protein LY79DRAFT_592981 [Colletotrichum navitas]